MNPCFESIYPAKARINPDNLHEGDYLTLGAGGRENQCVCGSWSLQRHFLRQPLFRDNEKALNPSVDLTFVPSIFKPCAAELRAGQCWED